MIAVHTQPKSGINPRALLGRAMHGLIPWRVTPNSSEFTQYNRLAHTFGLYRGAEMQWYGTGQFQSVAGSVAWRGRNPWPSGGVDRLTAVLPVPWASSVPWVPTSGCDVTIAIETRKDVGSSWAGDSIGTSFGPRNATSRLSAHITEQQTVIFDNPSTSADGRAQWNWYDNVDKFPLGRWHTFVFLARNTTRQIWAGGLKLFDASYFTNEAWNAGSADGWHWYGSEFPNNYSSSNPTVAHGACGLWNYALPEREVRALSLGFRTLYEGLPRSLGLPTPTYDIASLSVRARRIG